MGIVGFTDIHCHIIPGVDDGAQSFDEAKAMIQYAYEHDTRRIIATPHYGTSRAKASGRIIQQRYLQFNAWVKKHYPDMELFLGNELSYSHGLENRLIRGDAFTLAGSRYALVEFHPDDAYMRIRQGLQAIQMSGYWPVLAHAERCNVLAKNTKYIEELVHMGICVQINAKSVLGENGFTCKQCTKILLKNEWVHFIASDGHDLKKRTPTMQKAVFEIAKKYGKKYALEISVFNPGKILTNTYIN